MFYIGELNKGTQPDTTVYSIFSHKWDKVYDVELDKAEFNKLKAKKKHFTHVSWMQVLAQSCSKAKTGQYAKEVQSLKELKS